MIQKVDPPMDELIRRAADAAKSVLPTTPTWAVVAGTGPAELLSHLEDTARIDPADLAPGYLTTPLVWGFYKYRLLLIADTPPSPWEADSARLTLFLFRLLAALGVEKVILTTASASLLPTLPAGSLALVRDHLDFSGSNPLNRLPEEGGPWPLYPDLTQAYHPDLLKAVEQCATQEIPQVILTGVPGPSLPTPAEYMFYRNSGGEVVAMRGPGEVIAAVQAGLKAMLLVAITQDVSLPQPAPADLELMLAAAEQAAPPLTQLILNLIEEEN